MRRLKEKQKQVLLLKSLTKKNAKPRPGGRRFTRSAGSSMVEGEETPEKRSRDSFRSEKVVGKDKVQSQKAVVKTAPKQKIRTGEGVKKEHKKGRVLKTRVKKTDPPNSGRGDNQEKNAAGG